MGAVLKLQAELNITGFYSVFNFIQDPIFVVNDEGEIQYLNEFAVNSFKLNHGRTLRKKVKIQTILQHPEGEFDFREYIGALAEIEIDDGKKTSNFQVNVTTVPSTEDQYMIYLHDVTLEASLHEKYKSETKASKNFKEKSLKDEMTGIWNYRALRDRINTHCSQATDLTADTSIVIIDIDHFKKFNDTYGHQQGDAVLKAVSELLSSHVGEEGFVARYGGEEFVIIFNNLEAKNVLSEVDRIRAALENTHIKCFNDPHESLSVTASFGLIHMRRDEFAKASEKLEGNDFALRLINMADKNLYIAKANGRNQVIGNLVDAKKVLAYSE